MYVVLKFGYSDPHQPGELTNNDPFGRYKIENMEVTDA